MTQQWDIAIKQVLKAVSLLNLDDYENMVHINDVKVLLKSCYFKGWRDGYNEKVTDCLLK